MKANVKPVKLILGHNYEVGYTFDIKVVAKLIQTTPKGYKFFNLKTSKCFRQPVMYPSKEPNHVGKGETWFFVSESLVIKEVFENQINSNTINPDAYVEDSKMTHKPQELKIYKHQDLIKELNGMMIRIKKQLYQLPFVAGDINAMPTTEELDILTNKLMAVLREDSEPMIKY
jgi:hypothetical protein